jgi:hypothetical protein
MGRGGVDWINLAQDRDQWRAFVNTVMELWVHKMLRIVSVAAQLAASQEGHSSLSDDGVLNGHQRSGVTYCPHHLTCRTNEYKTFSFGLPTPVSVRHSLYSSALPGPSSLTSRICLETWIWHLRFLFWVLTSCSLVYGHQRFGVSGCLDLLPC